MLRTAPSQRKRIRWTSTMKGTSTGSFLLVGLRSCVARPARSRVSSAKLELVVNAERKLFEAVIANDPHRASQVASRSYSSCRARHDTGIVRPQPPKDRDGDSPAQHSLFGHGNRYYVAWRCPSWDGLRRLSRRMVGAQESANQEHGAWFLGSWAQLRGRRSPHSCPQPLHPSPPKRGEGARDEEAEGKGDRERENLEGGRLGTPAAFSSPWQSSPSF